MQIYYSMDWVKIKMIENIEKNKCTGCKLCADICPQSAIYYENDAYGFWYPKVNKELCTKCGLCQRKCPSLNKEFYKGNNNPVVYAAWSRDWEVRYNSTSGGVFWEIAKVFLMEGGVVAGCKWGSDWKSAEHIIAYSVEELEQLRGSKYIQSDTAGIYKKVKRELYNGKKVLFCGTPCQNAAMKMYIGDEENIYYFDFICRSINSPLAFRAYIDELEEQYGSKAKFVQLKNKKKGWQSMASRVLFENGQESLKDRTEDVWVQGFVGKDLYTRDCCFECNYRNLPRVTSDVTVGDFWGIEGESSYDMFRGISVILVNTDRGRAILDNASDKLFLKSKKIEDVLGGNFALLRSPQNEGKRELFFNTLSEKKFSFSVETSIGHSVKEKVIKDICQELESDKQKYRNNGIIDEDLYIELNFNSQSVVHSGGGKIIPYINTVIDMQESSQIIIEGDNDFEIGTNLFRGSKAETLIRMGRDAKWYIKHGGYLFYSTTVEVKDNATLETGYFSANTGTVIIASKRIIMGEDVMIGRNIMIYDSDFHQILDDNLKQTNLSEEVIIEDHVWLTANINVNKGVKIGQGSIITNQTVVNRNVPRYSLVAGQSIGKVIKENVLWSRNPVKKYQSEIANRRIILYGYGIIGKKFCVKYSDRIAYIIDNFVQGEEIWNFNRFCDNCYNLDMKDYVWVIASSNYYEELYEQIKKYFDNAFIISYREY